FRQWGHAGSGRSVLSLRGGRKLLLLQTTQHPERLVVDRARRGAPPSLVPSVPSGLYLRCFHLEAFLEPREKLLRPHAQRALAVQLRGVTVRRPEPFDRLAPRLLERLRIDARSQPAPAVQEVVVLLAQHLAQAVLQDLDRTADAGLDHPGESGVEDRVRGDELAPCCPGLVEVGEGGEAGRV